MTLKLISLSVLLCGALCAPAWGEKADRNKPMNVEADALRHDDLRQTSVFTGRVVVVKGTLVLRGARAELRQDADGNQFGVVTAEPGQLAYYRQKREGVDEFIEGQAESIEYDGKSDRVRFVRRADLRRLRGLVASDQMTGSLIVYDNVHDVFTVDGNVTSSGAPQPGGRVRAVLTPKVATSAPEVPPAPLRATSALPKDKP